MSDVFLSYAREDIALARTLSDKIEEAGLTTWWDRNLLPGQVFDREIEEEISKAKAVLVIWSKDSTNSRWVLAEAGEALEQGKFVPIQLDSSPIPLVFRRVQAARLFGWDGDSNDPEFRRVLDGLLALKGEKIASRSARERPDCSSAEWTGEVLAFERSISASSSAIVLRKGQESFLLEYNYSGGTSESVRINGAVVAKRGMFSLKNKPIIVNITGKSETYSCVVKPVYRSFFSEKLSGIQITINGKTIIDKLV